MMQCFWLIECRGASPLYYCNPGEFCSCANHAHKFLTKEAAESTMAAMVNHENMLFVAEHGWMS